MKNHQDYYLKLIKKFKLTSSAHQNIQDIPE